MQLLVTLQNVNEVNREALSPWAASSVYDSTQHNGLVTICQPSVACSLGSNSSDLIKMLLFFSNPNVP